MQSESDCVTLLTGALCLVSLLPVVPVTVVPLLSDVCEVFSRLVLFAHNKSGTCKPFYSIQANSVAVASVVCRLLQEIRIRL